MSKRLSRAQRNRLSRLLRVPNAVEARYVSDLRSFFRAVHKKYLEHLLTREDAKIPRSLSDLDIAVNSLIPKVVTKFVTRMFKGVSKSFEGLEVPGISPKKLGLEAEFIAVRDANIRLVEAAQRDYAADVRSVFSDPANAGARVEDIKQQLIDRGNVSESRAELIARDQTLKTNASINELRQREAGVTRYTWSTSQDERVREEHVELEGQVFDWDNPPDEGPPGEAVCCRCVAVPLIEL